jgi:hypothetical protein
VPVLAKGKTRTGRLWTYVRDGIGVLRTPPTLPEPNRPSAQNSLTGGRRRMRTIHNRNLSCACDAVEDAIVAALKNRVIEPQVIVSVVARRPFRSNSTQVSAPISYEHFVEGFRI